MLNEVNEFCGVTMRKLVCEIHGQVAQLVERSPEKAGVGGSIPSLATIFNNLQTTFFLDGCNWLHFDRF